MMDLNNVLNRLTNNVSPVIQRSDGLYEFVIGIMPADQHGTNLWGYFNHSGDSITLLGSWDTGNYEYNSETGQWSYAVSE